MILSIYIDTNTELIASRSEGFCCLNRVLVKKKIKLQCTSEQSFGLEEDQIATQLRPQQRRLRFAFMSFMLCLCLGCPPVVYALLSFRFRLPVGLGCSDRFGVAVLGWSGLFWVVWVDLSCSGLIWARRRPKMAGFRPRPGAHWRPF